jgi:hypothetical protein
MIKAFISKVAEGRTLCAIAECALQKNKKVAFISTELSTKKILERFQLFKPQCEKLTVFYIPLVVSTAGFYKKLEQLSEEYEIICIDLAVSPKKLDLQKLNDSCFHSFMNQCQELWITAQLQNVPKVDKVLLEKTQKENELIQVKQICRKIEHPFISGVSLIEAVDLETKEIKTYNLTNLFKNK